MEYTIEYSDSYFSVKLIGKSTIKDSAEYFDNLLAHKMWSPGALVLSDETDLEVGHLTINEIRKMAQICGDRRILIGSARFAAIVPHDLIFGMNRMFQVYVEPYWDAEIYAFRSRDEALKWLKSP